MRIRNIDHFVLVTEHLNDCLAFYTGVLGLEHVRAKGQHALKFGGQKINIHTKPGEFSPFARNPAPGSADFCLIAEGDIQGIRADLAAQGVKTETEILPRNGALGPMDSLYLRDPDGNLVEIAVYRK